MCPQPVFAIRGSIAESFGFSALQSVQCIVPSRFWPMLCGFLALLHVAELCKVLLHLLSLSCRSHEKGLQQHLSLGVLFLSVSGSAEF